MRIRFNDEERECDAGTRVQDLLAAVGMESRKGIAVAVNQSVVPAGQWGQTELKDGDAVLLIQATQGG